MSRDDERNQNQIIRKDARGCFVESKNDCFHLGKAHLEFAAYDMSKPSGKRFTGHVHIYIDVAEFLELANEAETGWLHTQMNRVKQLIAELEKNPGSEELKKQTNLPLYESMGGTSANRLKEPRADGMSLSRSLKLFVGQKRDYLLRAESGPGQTDAKGLIVPKYGNKPEQQVSVALSWRDLTQLLMFTRIHYAAWLTAQYRNAEPEGTRKQNGRDYGMGYGSEDGKNVADDTRMIS
jgi:hypothetical protein